MDCGKPMSQSARRKAPAAAAGGGAGGAALLPDTRVVARSTVAQGEPISCPFCGGRASGQQPFCPQCGRRLTAPGSGPNCPRCASPVAPGIKFCATCGTPRSEEHTSELQSPCNLVCRLLLEKKTARAQACLRPS